MKLNVALSNGAKVLAELSLAGVVIKLLTVDDIGSQQVYDSLVGLIMQDGNVGIEVDERVLAVYACALPGGTSVKRIALVVEAKSDKLVDDPIGFIAAKVDPAVLASDYHLLWEPGQGLTVTKHPLGSKVTKGFINAPDVTEDGLIEWIRVELEDDGLAVWRYS